MSGCQRKSSALMNRRNDCSEGQCGQGTASDLCMLPSAVQLRVQRFREGAVGIVSGRHANMPKRIQEPCSAAAQRHREARLLHLDLAGEAEAFFSTTPQNYVNFPTADSNASHSPVTPPTKLACTGQRPRTKSSAQPYPQAFLAAWLDQSVQREPGRYAVAQLLMTSRKCSHTA